MILIVAPNHQQAHYWLERQKPPLKPDRNVVIVTSRRDAERLYGYKLKDDDRVIIYKEIPVERYNLLMSALLSLTKRSDYKKEFEYES